MTKSVKNAAVIGWPIKQSLSPLIHTHWFEKYSVDADYRKIEVEPETLGDAVKGFVHGSEFIPNGLIGWNITAPHKETIVQYLDKIAPMAKSLGAVNTVFVKDGKSMGFNTDIMGFKKQLDQGAPNWPKEKPPLVIGAGGAARAAIAALLATSVPFVMVTNRTKEKADAIAEEMGQGRLTVVDWQDRNSAVMAAGVIANTTTLGMVGHADLDIDLSSADPMTVVYDIVYKPLETNLIKQAKARGLQTVDGLGMLVYQAAGAFKIWFDIEPDYDDALKDKLLAALSEE